MEHKSTADHTTAQNRPAQLSTGSQTPSFSPPVFQLQASPLQLNDPGEAIEDANTYYVSAQDATIRNNDNPSSFTGTEIPAGTRVQRTRTYDAGNVAKVEVLAAAPGAETAVGTTYWTTFSNVTVSNAVTDSGNHYNFFSDTTIHASPYGPAQTTNDATDHLAANMASAYTISERCGDFVKLQQGETVPGWVRESALLNEDQQDRKEYLTNLATWLNARYTEAAALTGDAQKNRTLGILSTVEHICNELTQGNSPDINALSTTPTYEAHSYTSFVPPELTANVRRFIELLEAGERGADETTVDGENLDWNARLGVNQYRTQSDNLAPPEATCGPTSFSMGAERLGYSREAVLDAIDAWLADDLGGEPTQAEIEDHFETKAEDFFEFFSGANWQKLRGGTNGGLVGEEDDLSEGFREWGQYEDLAYFLGHLNGHARGNIASGDSQDMLDDIHATTTDDATADGPGSTRINFGSNNPFTMAHRVQIQDTLAAGGAVILSLYHKGTQGGTHIVSVREVLSNGLGVDDPYGQINPDYRQGVAGDAFKDVGGSSGRASYDWKNVPHYDSDEDDYSERDFTREAGEELEADESRGANEVISWDMIEGSTNLLFYMQLYTR